MAIPISWNEVNARATRFAKDWQGAKSEHAEKQTFWNEFFDVFGVRRRSVATFEEPIKGINGKYGFIDLFWNGKLLVEHKSQGKDITAATGQAFDYIQDLKRAGREDDLPRYVIVSDFARVALFDLEPENGAAGPAKIEFKLTDLPRHARSFSFLRGELPVHVDPESPANAEAYDLMVALHQTLQKGGLVGEDLERLLVRLLFCLFAEDTGIFEPFAFENFITSRTRSDGSDLGAQLNRLFDILNRAVDRRQQNLDEDLAAFPYVNGGLFEKSLEFADFNSEMRTALIKASRFQWASISPAVFGSLFQGVMDQKERRQQGEHYTSEKNILKVIRPLFLTDLEQELSEICKDRSTRRKARLEEFQQKLRGLKFFDPACGCGNFLVVTYRELRRIELETLVAMFGATGFQRVLNVRDLCIVDVDQFYGIEIKEWPAKIAEVAMWLMDHQMNRVVADAFGQSFRRLPLRASPRIVTGNALKLEWRKVIKKQECNYILGNPPFVGKDQRTTEQNIEMAGIAGAIPKWRSVDYVANWYIKALDYIEKTNIVVGFVSTNSICQGEQVSALWPHLLKKGLKVNFAHRNFAWSNEAKGKAGVHSVILGFGVADKAEKVIWNYRDPNAEPEQETAQNISPYLLPGPSIVVHPRSTPLCGGTPQMVSGSKPTDNGNYMFTTEERNEFIRLEPGAWKFFRPCVGADEFINGMERWCLWLKDAEPEDIRKLPEVTKRIAAVRAFRTTSLDKATRKDANRAAEWQAIRHNGKPYIVVPRHSSENREIVPFGWVAGDTVSTDANLMISGAVPYHFGVLQSSMHMAWMRTVCGRLESRYRYSASGVYNTFPWPEGPSEAQRKAVHDAAEAALDARGSHPKSTLADLYDPLTMPTTLVRAHAGLDRAVDRCYRKQPFKNERERVAFLLDLYEKATVPLAPQGTAKKGRVARNGSTAEEV